MDPIDIQGHCLRFGEKLRRIRREVGISMETLGNRAGLHRTEIGHLEHARREPRLTTIFRVAHALDMSASRLLEGVDRLEGEEQSDPQPAPLVAVRGPRRRPQGGEEDPARAGSSTTCLGPRRTTNGASSDSGDRGSLRPG
jgi:transcriptional regulator with XRE-family HTH domain